MLAGYRLLEDLPRDWEILGHARAVRFGSGRPTVAQFGQRAFVLLIAAIRRSDRIAQTMEIHGLAAGPRNVHRPVRFSWRAAAFTASCAVALAAVWVAAG